MTLDELLEVQDRCNLRNDHIVYIGETYFCIAHTDHERAQATHVFGSGVPVIPLHECGLHQWIAKQSFRPMPVGVYLAGPHIVDLNSEPYGAAPWDLTPLPLV